jgi:hypothetical protein
MEGGIQIDIEVEFGRIWEELAKTAQAKLIPRKLLAMVHPGRVVDQRKCPRNVSMPLFDTVPVNDERSPFRGSR